jgi:tRNA pseudouridine55 synthase
LDERKSGVLVVDKPVGPTSHDVVARLRRALGTREVGHAGTLDPLASGVLVVAVGEGTKLVSYLTAADKAYEATVRLGELTDTLDAGGAVVETREVPADWPAHLDLALARERERTEQIPPIYSAIQKDGERSHAKARRGEAVDLAPRPVAVRSLDVVAAREREVDLVLVVSKGYYVRSLARDLAAQLGTVGHLTALRRTRSGSFSLADAVPLDPPPRAPTLSVEQAAARALPVTTLTPLGLEQAKVGKRIAPEDLGTDAEGPHAWLDAEGRLVAVGTLEDGTGRVLRGFNPS